MSRAVKVAGTIILTVAAFATLDAVVGKPEAEMTVTGETAEGAGGPPAISPFDIMLKLGRSLPVENWKSGYLIFESR
jgi:hypothetical protein